MTSSDAARILGPMAALWPNLNTARRETVWQGLNLAERQAVVELFGRDTCPASLASLPQDEVSVIPATNDTPEPRLSEHRQRWQGVADAGQREVRHRPRKRKVEPVAVVVEPVNVNRQRWQEAAKTARDIESRHSSLHSLEQNPPILCQEKVKPSPLAQPCNNAKSVPVKQGYRAVRRQRSGMGAWDWFVTILGCVCMTPIPYIIMAWLLWLACSSQYYAPMY